MLKGLQTWLGTAKQSDYVRKYIYSSNMRAALYMSFIVILLEIWMMLSLALTVAESAAAGTPRSLTWILNHGAWYVVLLAMAAVVLAHSIYYLRGKTYDTRPGNILLVVFSITCLAFGIHFGNNSYVQGEQVLAFATMTLFTFGILIWKPIPALVVSALAFGGFYLYIDHNLPATYGTQVNLFTLWIATFVVALSAYHQKVSEATKSEDIKRASERLRKIASYDELTNIPNMHTFNNAVKVIFEGIEEFDVRYAILYMDLENFKAYNDKHGFVAGDQLLCEVARGLQEIFSAELVARFSDDHFVAICETDNVRRRTNAAHELVASLRGDIRLRLKTGVYEPAMTEDIDVSHACDKARIACNEIKRHPQQFLNYYDDRLDEQIKQRQYVINNVGKAVKEGWIEVFYQPVVNCADGSATLCGYEALARWNDPEYGFMPPYAFVDTLEEFREIDKLDRCIIEQVCRDLRADLDAGRQVVPVSLNFSRLDFELYDVSAFLEDMAHKYDIPSKLLDVEITESALTEELGPLRRNMGMLRRERYSLWLDDFGSGYSSLNVLKDFHFDVLKIDMAFLRGFEDNPKARPILQSIVALAKELEMTTLCEGVETREQFEFLGSIGCDRAQGFLFGKPDPIKQLPAKL